MGNEVIYRQDAIDALGAEPEIWINDDDYAMGANNQWHYDVNALKAVPSAEPERVWIPCDIPPEHHRDVIVRGIEAIGNVTVHKVMQWDVDTWRPTNYAPSITWLDWSEI